eukprot:CAMPEP_0203718844 /NCGR_PEP_ID=MMETSP0092-20131115/3031_1 /ASSEMBLY_ACC=CAM_ASM_001090 /TAXON_ID=426623 /ORGANISM="Chaetoceros affinis, Strain CCMP159" /LENGTH=65 /DNA_ID=CAMNT_0050598077 /DNA_START=387 /DNA_END=584 /DNA_ORIENTATION=-
MTIVFLNFLNDMENQLVEPGVELKEEEVVLQVEEELNNTNSLLKDDLLLLGETSRRLFEDKGNCT